MFTWLYGPRVVKSVGHWELRSVEIDRDTVTDIVELLTAEVGPTRVRVSGPHDYDPIVGEKTVEINRLASLQDHELLRLMVSAADGDSIVTVDLRNANQPAITMFADGMDSVAERVTDLILGSGRPRVRWPVLQAIPRRVAELLPVLAVIVVLAVWPPEEVAYAVLALTAAGVVGYLLGAELRRRQQDRNRDLPRFYRGIRVLPYSREEQRNRRADGWRDFKILALSAVVLTPIGGLIGLLLARAF